VVVIPYNNPLYQEKVMTSEAIIAQKAPYAVDVESGKTYYWCSCGRSQKQPFCDGSHKETSMQPLAFTAEKTEKVYLCGCKQSANNQFCDGKHKEL
jgi:CDGSH iron-sulfur domain-containing protein 3